ncbi:MAG: methyl-accepting chemotaxis protein [Sphingomonas sp.]
MNLDQPLEPLRQLGARAITAFILANVVMIVPAGYALGSADTWIALALGALIAVAPLLCSFAGRVDAQARLIYAIALVLFPILYVYLFQRFPWQIDMHMYFFVCFSVMVLLCDPWPIIVAAAITVVHHLLFFLIMPEWVFPGSGSIPRVLFHGFMIGCETVMLLVAVRLITNLTLGSHQAREEADAARAGAEQARACAEQARFDAEEALAQSRLAEARAERAHRDRLAAEAALKAASDDRRRLTADEIDASIGQLVHDLRLVVEQVSNQSGRIITASRSLAAEAKDMQLSSEHAVLAIAGVATNSDELAHSIRAIGGNAKAAHDVAVETAASIAELGPAINTLTGEVDAARDILEWVSEIAQRSNLLALNATIEAARSGEAGLGFGVVAGEMKQMAAATARAADDIAGKLGAIVGAASGFTERVTAAIANVATITSNSAAIATGVAQQHGATAAIADNAEAVLAKVTETDARSRTLSEIAADHQAMAMSANEVAVQLDQRVTALGHRMDVLLSALRAA